MIVPLFDLTPSIVHYHFLQSKQINITIQTIIIFLLCYGLQHLVQPVEDEADTVHEDVVVKGSGVVRRFVVVEGDAGSEYDGGDAVLQENVLVTKKSLSDQK